MPAEKMTHAGGGTAAWAIEKYKPGTVWHIAVNGQPKWGPTPTRCGKTITAYNVTWEGEPPPTNDLYVCAKCVAWVRNQTVKEVLIQAVKDHALAHYNDGGWDVIVECWEDEQIGEAIGKATTVTGAIKKIKGIVSVYADYQADAINSAF